MKQRNADINRNVLAALKDFGTANLDEIAAFHGFAILRPAKEEMVTAANDMLTYGYIEHPIAGDYDYFRITAAGLRQINSDGKRDPAVWGRQAV